VKTRNKENIRKTIKEKVMKTNIRTIITICAFGFIGLNTNAANYKNAVNTVNVENSESAQFLLNEDVDAIVDFQKEAQILIKLVADREEAKAIQKLVEEGFAWNESTASFGNEAEAGRLEQRQTTENVDATTDFRKEAQLLTKLVADREEAKAVQKLIGEGKLAGNI
jgi:hypothetical protein